ncbi:MAG: hypothetical protein WBD47_12890 [Phormidesmis sp.]
MAQDTGISRILPTEAEHFKGRHKRSIGIALLMLGLACSLISLWRMLLSGGFNSVIVVGIVAMIMGYLYLTRPYFSLAPNRLTVYGPIGNVIKRYSFVDFDAIRVEGNRIYIEGSTDSSSREKVRLSKWLIHAEDWKRLVAIAHASPSL